MADAAAERAIYDSTMARNTANHIDAELLATIGNRIFKASFDDIS